MACLVVSAEPVSVPVPVPVPKPVLKPDEMVLPPLTAPTGSGTAAAAAAASNAATAAAAAAAAPTLLQLLLLLPQLAFGEKNAHGCGGLSFMCV